MITKRVQFLLVLLVVAAVAVASAYGPEGNKTTRLSKPAGNDLYATFLINNVFAYYSNNGDGGYNPFLGAAGWEYPKGSGNTSIFEEGLIWGVYKPGINDASHPFVVGGSAYRHGLQAGPILSVGHADDPGLATNRVYRVRPDIGPTATLSDPSVLAAMTAEAALISRYEAGVTAASVLAKYIADWNAWPAAQGAPFTDANHNGTYEPGTDIPGVTGADQTLWHVSNDLVQSRTTYLYGSKPIGLEMQRTIWGYNRQGALGNTVFVRYRVINKTGAPLDSTYMVQWADPDLGDGGDDFAGCDTTRNLGYVYNGRARDSEYSDRPPAVGFNFFQGPAVVAAAGDSAAFDNRWVHGKANLRMSAFVFFINGNATYVDPTQGDISGTTQWVRLMKGTVSGTGADFIDPGTGLVTKFTQAGDPVTGKGWIDGSLADPGDRRLCMVSGPFQMGTGDTSEIVVGQLVGNGGDRLSSIDVLRFYSDLAQGAFNVFFDLAQPIPAPPVTVVNLDGEIVLDWSNMANAKTAESFVSKGYVFQGYNVYQATTSLGDSKKLLATYDLVDGVGKIFDRDLDQTSGVIISKPVQYGNDNGVVRTYDATMDAIRGKTLINYQRYYYAVTAYSYDPTATPKTLESGLIWREAVPQTGVPGQRFHAAYGDTVQPVHATGVASNVLSVEVVNPSVLKAHDYQVSVVATDSVFNVDLGVNVANPKWQLTDVTTGQVLLAPSTKYKIFTDNNVVDGLRIGLQATPFYTAGQEISSFEYTPSSHLNWKGINWGLSQTNLGNDPAGNAWGLTVDVGANFRGSSILPQDVDKNVEIRFDSTGFNKAAGTGGQKAYCFLRTAAGTGAALYQGFFPQPFTVWDVTNAASPRQIDFMFLEAVGLSTNDSVWAPGAGSGNREYFYFVDRTYTATPNSAFTVGVTTEGAIVPTLPCLYEGSFAYVSASKPVYQNGDVWRLTVTNVLKTTDSWTFSLKSRAQTAATALAKADVDKVNVVPNPYFGFSLLEPSKYVRYVTFTHLPPKATIRIFTLAGTPRPNAPQERSDPGDPLGHAEPVQPPRFRRDVCGVRGHAGTGKDEGVETGDHP